MKYTKQSPEEWAKLFHHFSIKDKKRELVVHTNIEGVIAFEKAMGEEIKRTTKIKCQAISEEQE